MDTQVKWLGGSQTETLLGNVWKDEPTGVTIRVVLYNDYCYHHGKYNIIDLLHELKNELLIIKAKDGWLINTKTISRIVTPPRPGWFIEAVVPVNPTIIEEQFYIGPEDWFYIIGIDLKLMACDFPKVEESYDAFIVHASEDKIPFVRPLAYQLKYMGFKIWFDEFDIKLGDSIRQSIDKGLSKSRFGIAVISHAFIKKKWTQYELNGLLAREMSGAKTVLPVWYDINREDVMMYSQSIADKLAVIGTSENVEEVASEIAEILRTNQ